MTPSSHTAWLMGSSCRVRCHRPRSSFENQSIHKQQKLVKWPLMMNLHMSTVGLKSWLCWRHMIVSCSCGFGTCQQPLLSRVKLFASLSCLYPSLLPNAAKIDCLDKEVRRSQITKLQIAWQPCEQLFSQCGECTRARRSQAVMPRDSTQIVDLQEETLHKE